MEELEKISTEIEESSENNTDDVVLETEGITEEDACVDVVRSVERQKGILSYLHDLVFGLAAVLLVFMLFLRVVIVSGPSMLPTLHDGDSLILLSNVLYGKPQYGDIVVASKDSFKNGEPIIKRVIATEGQFVDIDFNAGIVFVGESLDTMMPLTEDYTKTLTTRDEGMQFPLQVDEGCIFVMGDNRDLSKDSRNPEIGLIDTREVLGKAIFLILPGIDPATRSREFSRLGGL